VEIEDTSLDINFKNETGQPYAAFNLPQAGGYLNGEEVSETRYRVPFSHEVHGQINVPGHPNAQNIRSLAEATDSDGQNVNTITIESVMVNYTDNTLYECRDLTVMRRGAFAFGSGNEKYDPE
jgi:hypothetical protein